jgi:hypothetical protein
MAEERTLGIARARETWDEEQPSKEQLQRRMDEARDSITNTVSEIKDNVAQQVETVKDALDWREHFKKQPLAWSLGAAGVGFLMGYGLAAVIRGEDESPEYLSETPGTYARSLTRESLRAPIESNGKDDGPGMLERFKETSAYERLSKEAGAIGDRVVEELSTTAQAVVLPYLLNKIKNWAGLDLSEKPASMASAQPNRQIAHEASFEKSGEL